MCELGIVRVSYITWLKLVSLSAYLGIKNQEEDIPDNIIMHLGEREVPPFKRWHNAELEDSSGVSIKGSGFNLNTSGDGNNCRLFYSC